MKKIINNKDQIVDDMLSGYIKANSDRVKFSNNSKRIILRSHPKNIEKTAMLIGNGSGHEPIAMGWVGEGLLDANVVGDIFAAPSGDLIFEGIQIFKENSGCILLISNHAGDVMNGEMAIELAKECEQSALSADERICNSDGASFDSFTGFKVYGNSHGQLVGYPSSRHSLSCVMIASEGDDMERDYAYTVNRDFSLLDSAENVGLAASKEVLSRLQPQTIATGKVPVLFRADIANTIWGHFIAAISGGNLYRKSSFLLDALGNDIFPEFLNISERPHITKALASSAFDSEGVLTKDREIITDGALQTYLLTSYSARKLGLSTTGHAGGIHNWLVNAKGHDGEFDAMLKTLGTGLLVTELMGQGVNVVNGDYSRGASGFWVENGEIAYPVSEITIAGNLADMFKGIVAVGSDVDMRGSIRTGSVLIDEMQVAGH